MFCMIYWTGLPRSDCSQISLVPRSTALARSQGVNPWQRYLLLTGCSRQRRMYACSPRLAWANSSAPGKKHRHRRHLHRLLAIAGGGRAWAFEWLRTACGRCCRRSKNAGARTRTGQSSGISAAPSAPAPNVVTRTGVRRRRGRSWARSTILRTTTHSPSIPAAGRMFATSEWGGETRAHGDLFRRRVAARMIAGALCRLHWSPARHTHAGADVLPRGLFPWPWRAVEPQGARRSIRAATRRRNRSHAREFHAHSDCANIRPAAGMLVRMRCCTQYRTARPTAPTPPPNAVRVTTLVLRAGAGAYSRASVQYAMRSSQRSLTVASPAAGGR